MPEEFEAIDYTAAEEDMRQKVQGPDRSWLEHRAESAKACEDGLGTEAPQAAKDLVTKARDLAEGPVLSRLEEASDDLYAWAAARVALDPQATFEELVGEMATYGLGDMAAEAAELLDKATDCKAGSKLGLVVSETQWGPGKPGRGHVTIDGVAWTFWDYKEEVAMSEELAGVLQQPDEGVEKRQCVTKAIAAGILWRRHARQPSLAEVAEKSCEIRLEQARQAAEAQAVMGEPADRVAPIEAELRVYTHDMIHAHHDKDFRSHAVFPVPELEDGKLVVIRANYLGNLVVETVTGSMWTEGGWLLWVLIWRGHMVVLEPPPAVNQIEVLEKWQPYDTPALGFLFFWHSRHDQERTSPGRVVCRLCKGGRKAGDQSVVDPCASRRVSNLAAAAIVGCIKAGSTPLSPAIPVRGDEACLQEVFAGKAVLTQAWQQAGLPCMEPIEVFHDPHLRQGYIAACDLTLPHVVKDMLYSARRGKANLWWYAPPCTSFCDWSLENGGTRTFEVPEGGAGGLPLKDVEQLGNNLSKAAAEGFLAGLETGAFPVAESTARSGRYPKMWDLPWWREILARPDVDFVEFPMCAFGLGPPEGDGFYHHRTRVVFRKCPALATALSRRCPGVGGAHRHVTLKGSRPGAAVTRCAEAGVYADEFVKVVVEVLSAVLVPVGGGQTFSPQEFGDETRAAGELQSPFNPARLVTSLFEVPAPSLSGSHPEHSEAASTGPHDNRVKVETTAGPGPLHPHGHPRFHGPPGWLDNIEDDGEIVSPEELPVQACAWADFGEGTRAGSTEPSALGQYQAPTHEAKQAAEVYIEHVGHQGGGTSGAWASVCEKGGHLLSCAGSVQRAAESLWQVREERNLNNLAGVDDQGLDTILHPDMLAYMREVRHKGLAARYNGPRQRVRTKPHPNARRNLDQVFKQIWKDVVKQRVLVVPSDHPVLTKVVSSPFNAVDKMLPDRSLAPDKRVVHDQRGVNAFTDKVFHPPALQPKHVQVARLVLWIKQRLPGITVLISKRDIAGAFRLLWVDPVDVELFAGDLPWCPEFMEDGEAIDGKEFTVIYLVSSFGFSGSPGEWTVWGRATEEYLRAHCPCQPRRDLSWTFDSKILVDDNVLVEPWVGLRPWVAGDLYDAGVMQLLGKAAVNKEKNEIEGPFRTFQTVWGLVMETTSEEVHLPERRVAKGAVLLSEVAFDYGVKDITVREIQRFRGIATGWTVVVKGLKNELKAADRFLGLETDGGAKARPKACSTEEDEDQAWRDLWELFESCRWLCARPETWPSKFGAGMRELLPIRERLALPEEIRDGAVFVSSDATRLVIGAIDWTNGKVMRMGAALAARWVWQCGDHDGEEVAIHVAEMLSFLAFACKMGPSWVGKVILYGGDNQVVRQWIMERQSGTVSGRLMVRVLNMVEMRYRCTVVAAWWRTYHNTHADYITRCSDQEFLQWVEQRGWTIIDIGSDLKQAVEDSERFGPCLLAWDDNDRQELLRLKEQRLKRTIPAALAPAWSSLHVVELGGEGRWVFDFAEAAHLLGCHTRTSGWTGPVHKDELVFAALPPDRHGKVGLAVARAALHGEARLVVLEGPRAADWQRIVEEFKQACWHVFEGEFVTTEFGEVAARRRVCVVASGVCEVGDALGHTTCRGLLAPPMSSKILPTKFVTSDRWLRPCKVLTDAGVPRDPLLPVVKGHYWDQHGRHNLYGTSGPLLWPLRNVNGESVEESVVFDPRGPPGTVRVLDSLEVWLCQGRTEEHFRQLQIRGLDAGKVLVEGNKATGGHTASALVIMAGYVDRSGGPRRSGGGYDSLGEEALTKLLEWLGRWKRGLFPRAPPDGDCRAGGHPEVGEKVFVEVGRLVWRWGCGWAHCSPRMMMNPLAFSEPGLA